jgi:hypothetical protein
MTTYIKRYFENLATLISCKTGKPNSLELDISYYRTRQIKNCFFFKAKFFFFFCENYCEQFNLVNPSDLLDNEIKELVKFFNYVADNKEAAFYSPNNNILSAGYYEEDFVKKNIDYVLKTKVFFSAGSTHQIDLSTYTTDVVYYGGMNPWTSVENNGFAMNISGEKLIVIGVGLVIWFITCLY